MLEILYDLPERQIIMVFPPAPPSNELTQVTITWKNEGLLWRIKDSAGEKTTHSPIHHSSVDARLRDLRGLLGSPVMNRVVVHDFSGNTRRHDPANVSWKAIRHDILATIQQPVWEKEEMAPVELPGHELEMEPLSPMDAAYHAYLDKLDRRERKKQEARDAVIRRMEEIRRKKAAEKARSWKPAFHKPEPPQPVAPPPRPKPPTVVPPVEIVSAPWDSAPVNVETAKNLTAFLLSERASVIWVSNQTDSLLCLPMCAIEQLEYQIRTALRAMGTLRGNALLSDEVGLGKTIEAGLILKEYLTRGMVRRFLVLTVPSLVDQWAEELESKFGIIAATTNQPAFKADPEAFWTGEKAVIASVHTFKQAHHLALAMKQSWQMVIVDEAHYLRNRASQAWQAVNALPRQFLLLLTATPVQNSIEELYNLVTLLRPGQLPSPKEFKARFVDPDRPRVPKEPEALRELLGQVMIRNTRANAGVKLPPRRAETVLYEPQPSEADAWNAWDRELRERLKAFSPAQASLWGRLLLQTAGSSPNALRDVLRKFPDRPLAERWSRELLLAQAYERRAAVIPPLAQTEGGVVVFTQFLATQEAIATSLTAAKVPVWVLNGQTPPAERQGIARQFQEKGGALLLSRSGTEGRNLQFCHRLVNFDLPWNPMEIEQRIGRLHRLGQERRVEVYNLVQAGTLQAHLLDILQEKLNLFELTIGETGLVLGDRFSSDDFEEEVFQRWQQSEGEVGAALQSLGEELMEARDRFNEVKKLDETLFASDYET